MQISKTVHDLQIFGYTYKFWVKISQNENNAKICMRKL